MTSLSIAWNAYPGFRDELAHPHPQVRQVGNPIQWLLASLFLPFFLKVEKEKHVFVL